MAAHPCQAACNSWWGSIIYLENRATSAPAHLLSATQAPPLSEGLASKRWDVTWLEAASHPLTKLSSYSAPFRTTSPNEIGYQRTCFADYSECVVLFPQGLLSRVGMGEASLHEQTCVVGGEGHTDFVSIEHR